MQLRAVVRIRQGVQSGRVFAVGNLSVWYVTVPCVSPLLKSDESTKQTDEFQVTRGGLPVTQDLDKDSV